MLMLLKLKKSEVPEMDVKVNGLDPSAKIAGEAQDRFDNDTSDQTRLRDEVFNNPERWKRKAGKAIEIESQPPPPSVRKPKPNEWFRIHPDSEYTFDCYIYVAKDGVGDTTYFVPEELKSLFGNQAKPAVLVLAVTIDGTPIIWPVKLPNEERTRKDDKWSSTRLDALASACQVGMGPYRSRHGPTGLHDLLPEGS
jgi:hypothetical protein